jgi:hypothetical protein
LYENQQVPQGYVNQAGYTGQYGQTGSANQPGQTGHSNQPGQTGYANQPGQTGRTNQSGQDIQTDGGNKDDKLKTAMIVVAIVVVLLIGLVIGLIIVNIRLKKTGTETTDIEVSTYAAYDTEYSSENIEPSTENSETTQTLTEESETSTETSEAMETGGEESGYSDSQLLDAAEKYCSQVYGFSAVSTNITARDNGKLTIEISVTIDGNTGTYGSMTVDKFSGEGYDCRGESMDIFAPEETVVNIYYIIPDSATRVLGYSDLENLSDWELTLARNEIYARHGRKFKDSDISEYFYSQAWYAGIVEADSFDSSVLSKTESANINFIKSYEEELEEDSDDDLVTDNYYILPNSDTEYLTDEDVMYLSDRELMLARNEIYARHGRKFNDSEIRTYFESQAWYNPTIEPGDFSDSMLSKVEKANIALIQKYEN